ncbi:hypothetical protein [Candidatus Symbiopectobacterium sp. NZEC135]|uniref:hypothetical protein n=1 Tax=Candidatus Symbiopectobacterium sp. NZEC135 TaxID=2820471 RepID=UPI0022279EDD|nr:hypothetical protein [Candidatus Symbiopectobacterium sp. NZEC135]MCW2477704.1 hypothetical protein [Candidatus Symbiopectobacterium sp. NZEC135]
MADIIDEANDLTDLNIQHALANRKPPMIFTGKCRNCRGDIKAGLFCDEYCRDDYEKLKRAQQLREGKV